MTRSQLNTYIDTNITNKTAVNSLTPVDEGNALREVANYVDQQDALNELLANKSTNVTTDGASDTKYPSVKAVKTYVDANVGGIQISKVNKTTITHLQLLDFTTPVVIVPAQAGIVNLPIQMLMVFKNNLGWGDSGGTWTVKNGGFTVGSTNSQIGNASVLQQYFITASNITATVDLQNQNITINSNTNLSSPVDPTTTVDVYVIYNSVTI